MAARKQFQSTLAITPKLKRLLDEARAKEVSEEDRQPTQNSSQKIL